MVQDLRDASGTAFETGVGWVGVTTYNDKHGNLRVKKEILVAMSGITTLVTVLHDSLVRSNFYVNMFFNELNEDNFLLFAIKIL